MRRRGGLRDLVGRLQVACLVLVTGLLSPAAWSHAAAVPCLAIFTSPLFVPVSGQLTDILIDDKCEFIYLTNASSNRIEVFSLLNGSLTFPIAVGSSPTGLDTNPDGHTLYVANSGGNNLSIVDLINRVERNKIPVPAGFLNDRPFSIAVAQSGLVLFSTTFDGSGFGARMMQLDPVSNIVSQRTDFWRFGGVTTEATTLKASGDKSAIGIVAGDISSGPVFKYRSATNSFTPEKDLNAFVSSIALDETGSIALVNPGTFVLDSNLNLSGTVAGGSFGVAVDPAGSIGYSVGGSRIDVLNLSNFTKTDSLNIGDTIGNGNIFVPQGVGRLSISKDGTILAVITDNGFAVVQTQSVRFVTFAIRISHARMKFHEEQGPGHDSFRVAGDFTLDTHSNGIDPLTENVTLEIGSLALTIPGGSFTQTGPHFNFQGTIDGVAVSFSLRPHGPSRFRFNAEGDGADLAGTSVPLTVGLIFGDDRGSIKLNEGEAELHSEKPRTRGGE